MVQMRGINWSDAIQNGDLRDSLNLSARRWPYITTRKGRLKQTGYQNVTALTSWDKLVAVQGTSLLYDGQVVGTVTAGKKQFAVVNTKMVIWPDKVYLDIKDQTVKPLAAELTGSGAVFTTSKMTVNGWTDLTTKFKAGDGITISGCTTEAKNNKDIVIKSVTATEITVTDNTFTAATEGSTSIKLERKIPDLDYICESENRLWGCNNDTQTIYASALGDPTNFYVYEGLSTDAYTLAVGTKGKFTGCCKLSSSVLFWKETQLHKMLGSYPAEYAMYTYEMDGLQDGCQKSQQVINDTLFYKGPHGVYAYSGGTPVLISDNFGEKEFTDAVAGNDGDSYYLSVKDGAEHRLMVYETKTGIWVLEDGTEAVDFARLGKKLYMLAGGDVYLLDGEDTPQAQEWMAQFAPMYETIDGKKAYSKILMRLELPKGSYMTAQMRCDGKPWQTCGKVVGKEHNVTSLRLAANRCDKFELRLEGKGPCTILGISRAFMVGSDVK
uniref:Stabilization protein n=2 Tax=unclassified Caudoviricetes TaxID=2788787 RepID=A0A8S5S6Z3_9CAUD|nr:MAG TPA: stabilization protein [Siphoviridae sp. ctdau33]